MNVFKKIIQTAKNSVENSFNKANNDIEISEKITMEQLDELQREILMTAQNHAQVIIDNAKESADKLINDAIDQNKTQKVIFFELLYDQICEVLSNMNLFYKFVAYILKNNKSSVIGQTINKLGE